MRIDVPPNTDWFRISPDGRSLVTSTNTSRWAVVTSSPQSISFYELPGGTHWATFEESIRFDVSPDGRHIITADRDNRKVIRALPSGELRWTLPEGGPIEWSHDGRYLLAFKYNSGWYDLSVFNVDTAKQRTGLDVRHWPCKQRPDGSGFVAIDFKKWQLISASFDPEKPITAIPLPGPQAKPDYQQDIRPLKGSVSIDDVASNNDGSIYFALLRRYEPDGDKDRAYKYIARWDQATQQWTESYMGPQIDSRSFRNWQLDIDQSGRHVSTERVFRGQYAAIGRHEQDHWGEEEAKKHEGRQLWDATTLTPTSRNDSGFPAGIVYFCPQGKRIIQVTGTKPSKMAIYDAQDLKLLASHDRPTWDNPLFTPDGTFMAIVNHWQGSDYSFPNWMPDWLTKIIDPPGDRIRIVRLSDGKVVRQLSNRSSPQFTTDGFLWTVILPKGDDTIAVERWSPEASTPWWMIVFSTFGLGLIVWDWRRRGVSTAQSALTRTVG